LWGPVFTEGPHPPRPPHPICCPGKSTTRIAFFFFWPFSVFSHCFSNLPRTFVKIFVFFTLLVYPHDPSFHVFSPQSKGGLPPPGGIYPLGFPIGAPGPGGETTGTSILVSSFTPPAFPDGGAVVKVSFFCKVWLTFFPPVVCPLFHVHRPFVTGGRPGSGLHLSFFPLVSLLNFCFFFCVFGFFFVSGFGSRGHANQFLGPCQPWPLGRRPCWFFLGLHPPQLALAQTNNPCFFLNIFHINLKNHFPPPQNPPVSLLANFFDPSTRPPPHFLLAFFLFGQRRPTLFFL